MASDEPTGTRSGPIVLRIKLRYDDVESMVQRFAPNVGKVGLFLPTRSLQPLGAEIKFELRLANDQPVLVGLGRVKSAKAPDPDQPRLAFGVGVELMRVTRESRDLILRMLERRRQLGLPDVGLPTAADLDAARRSGGVEGAVRDVASGPAGAAAGGAPVVARAAGGAAVVAAGAAGGAQNADASGTPAAQAAAGGAPVAAAMGSSEVAGGAAAMEAAPISGASGTPAAALAVAAATPVAATTHSSEVARGSSAVSPASISDASGVPAAASAATVGAPVAATTGTAEVASGSSAEATASTSDAGRMPVAVPSLAAGASVVAVAASSADTSGTPAVAVGAAIAATTGSSAVAGGASTAPAVAASGVPAVAVGASVAATTRSLAVAGGESAVASSDASVAAAGGAPSAATIGGPAAASAEPLASSQRPSGPIAVGGAVSNAGAGAPQVEPLTAEAPRRKRPLLSELIESASGPISSVAAGSGLDEDVDVGAALTRARSLATGDLDRELETLRDQAAAPLSEISIEAASAELARQLGGAAVRRDKSQRWAPPPAITVERETVEQPLVLAAAVGERVGEAGAQLDAMVAGSGPVAAGQPAEVATSDSVAVASGGAENIARESAPAEVENVARESATAEAENVAVESLSLEPAEIAAREPAPVHLDADALRVDEPDPSGPQDLDADSADESLTLEPAAIAAREPAPVHLEADALRVDEPDPSGPQDLDADSADDLVPTHHAARVGGLLPETDEDEEAEEGDELALERPRSFAPRNAQLATEPRGQLGQLIDDDVDPQAFADEPTPDEHQVDDGQIDDEIHQLSEADFEEVESTQIGESPEPVVFDGRVEVGLGARLDPQLAEAESDDLGFHAASSGSFDRELDRALGFDSADDSDLARSNPVERVEPPPAHDSVEELLDRGLDREIDRALAHGDGSMIGEPIDPSLGEDLGEEIEDFEIIAEADAEDADLLAAHGEADASAAEAGYADAPPARPSMSDFAARLDLGEESGSDLYPLPASGYDELSGITPPVGAPRYDRLETPQDSFEAELEDESTGAPGFTPPHEFDQSDVIAVPPALTARHGSPRRRAPAPPPTASPSPARPEPSILRSPPASSSAPASAGEDFELEEALDALDVDLDDLSIPHASTELHREGAKSQRIPGRPTIRPPGPTRANESRAAAPSSPKRASSDDGVLIDFDDE
ncbi:MAG: hypothetical protein ACTHU0_33980 [Kofleriaceae bacterium]